MEKKVTEFFWDLLETTIVALSLLDFFAQVFLLNFMNNYERENVTDFRLTEKLFDHFPLFVRIK